MSIGNYPLSFEYDRAVSEVKAESIPKKAIYSAFKSLGYDLVQCYYRPSLYKTNAPFTVVYDIFKAWKEKKLEGTGKSITDKATGNALNINSKPIQHRPDFDFEADKIKKHLKENKVRYTDTPAFWGPGSRAVSAKVKKAEVKAKDKAIEEGEEAKQEE